MRGLKIKILKSVIYWCVDALRGLRVEVGVFLTAAGNEVILIEKGGEE
jgi:hypothetical protein